MPDKLPDELAALAGTDFDVPMTEEFVTAVHRGVRRRRRFRTLAVSGAAAATLAVAALAGTTVGPSPEPTVTARTYRPLDGYEIRTVPPGLRTTHPDSVYTYAVEKNRLRVDGPGPGPTEPSAAVTMRIFVRGNGGNHLWVTVLRPERTTPATPREKITEWLTGWSTGGAAPRETFPVPAGEARLISGPAVVITTPDGVVITVSGVGTIPPADLKAVAAGIHPG